MNKIIKYLFNKNIQYNILSLVNVVMGFVFMISLGRKFGASEQTDIYFISLVVIGYLSYFVKITWVAISQYYIEIKNKNIDDAKDIYNILLNNIIAASIGIIIVYFLISSTFDFFDKDTIIFLNVFVFYLLLQNILFFNKVILNFEKHFAAFYIVDIYIYMSNLLVVLLFIEDDIILVAYSTLFATSVAIIWQWYLIFKKQHIKYEFLFYKREISKEIYKNSFKINIGSILYGSKDIITAIIFTSYGSGMYTLFNYANRFAGVIVQVVNAPIINIFIVKISHIISKKYYSKIESLIQEVLIKTVALFLIASMLLYIALPYLLTIFFDGKFSLSDMEIIQYIFVYLVIYYLIPTIESPFVSVVNLLKMFNYVLFINTVFFIFMAIGYAFFELFELNYEYFLIFLILSQLSNAWLYIKKYRIEVRKLVT